MDEKPKGQKTILNLYAVFGVSLILSVLPSVAAAVLSMIFFIGLLVAAYHFRKKADDYGLLDNHTTFIIRTLWISAFLSLITTGIATIYMLGGVNYAPFEPCAQTIANQGIAWLETAQVMEIYGLIEPCLHSFLGANQTLLLNALIIAGGPIMLYMVYRLAKGVNRAMKGYRLADPKSWF